MALPPSVSSRLERLKAFEAFERLCQAVGPRGTSRRCSSVVVRCAAYSTSTPVAASRHIQADSDGFFECVGALAKSFPANCATSHCQTPAGRASERQTQLTPPGFRMKSFNMPQRQSLY